MHFLFSKNKKKFETFFIILKVLNNMNQFLAKKFEFKKRMNSNDQKKKKK
jgi:hypothetical protein